MKFGATDIDDAEGAILVHSVKLSGARLRKGRVLSATDIELLRSEGVNSVIAARFETGDVPEDSAANRIASATAGKHVERQEAFTGRANLFAACDGLLVLDTARIGRINRIDESITIATLPDHAVVRKGQMLATVKIIPFSAGETAIQDVETLAAEDGGTVIAVAPFSAKRAGLIMTTLPDTKANVLDKTRQVLADRLSRYGSDIKQERRCAHEKAAVAQAIRELLEDGCSPVLIFGASAITDRRDEIPSGIVEAGGVVEHFGMPVDPGNLLLLGRHDDVAVIGLPGCARSPKLNGFDWVLERLLADQPVSRDDIVDMGIGGLLKEIPTRPQPRLGGDGVEAAIASVPRIAALVLAAGQSRRMGSANKMLAEIDGIAMVRRAVDAAMAAQTVETIVVTGHGADEVGAVLAELPVKLTHNEDYAQGLSTSLKAGIAALADNIDGVVVLLGDMPHITFRHIDRLIAAFDPLEGRSVCVPTFKGKRGNPVLFARDLFVEMETIGGDSGAKHLIGTNEELVAEVPMEDDAIFLDIDTPTALAAARSGNT
jgi:molybdenum cofactor cytidylyltransferase